MAALELSIVIPFLNEVAVLPLLRERLAALKATAPEWELIFVSDGSTDGSIAFIEAWAREDPAVKLVVLTRNFGHQSAVSAGLTFAGGNSVGVMDADLQDEPEVLVEMYRTLQSEKLEVVYAIRTSRQETVAKRLFYYLFYRLYLFLADTPVQIDSGDFCVMSRRAVQLLFGLSGKASLRARVARLARIGGQTISCGPLRPGGGRPTILVRQIGQAGSFRADLFFDPAAPDWFYLRHGSLPLCGLRRDHLSGDRTLYRHAISSTGLFHPGRDPAFLEWDGFSLSGCAGRIHWPDLHGGKRSSFLSRGTNLQYPPG